MRAASGARAPRCRGSRRSARRSRGASRSGLVIVGSSPEHRDVPQDGDCRCRVERPSTGAGCTLRSSAMRARYASSSIRPAAWSSARSRLRFSTRAASIVVGAGAVAERERVARVRASRCRAATRPSGAKDRIVVNVRPRVARRAPLGARSDRVDALPSRDAAARAVGADALTANASTAARRAGRSADATCRERNRHGRADRARTEHAPTARLTRAVHPATPPGRARVPR